MTQKSISNKDRNITVAVCLAAYNGRKWLKEQLQSIIKQENVTVTIFISVDRSNDGTENWINEFSKINNNIILLPTGCHFGGAASNFFRLLKDIDFSCFDYISLSDQDDIWYPDKLWRAIQVIQSQNSDCYSSNVLAFWKNGSKRLIDKAQPQVKWDFLFEAAGPGCTYLFKRKVISDFKSALVEHGDTIDKVVLHDWLLYAYARAKGYKWVIDRKPSMLYRQHSSNQVGVNTGMHAYIWRTKQIITGRGIAQARLIVQIVGLENTPFYQPWKTPGRLGMLWLGLNAYRCRRKLNDKFIFAALCILLSIIGDRSNE